MEQRKLAIVMQAMFPSVLLGVSIYTEQYFLIGLVLFLCFPVLDIIENG